MSNSAFLNNKISQRDHEAVTCNVEHVMSNFNTITKYTIGAFIFVEP